MGIIIESEKIDENGLYCTQADRDNEQRIGNSFAKELLKHPEGIVCTLSESRTHPFDAYFCVNEKVVAIAELKKRNPKSDAKYDGTYLTYGIEIGKAKKLVCVIQLRNTCILCSRVATGLFHTCILTKSFANPISTALVKCITTRTIEHVTTTRFTTSLNEWKREVIQASVHLRKDHHHTKPMMPYWEKLCYELAKTKRKPHSSRNAGLFRTRTTNLRT